MGGELEGLLCHPHIGAAYKERGREGVDGVDGVGGVRYKLCRCE